MMKKLFILSVLVLLFYGSAFGQMPEPTSFTRPDYEYDRQTFSMQEALNLIMRNLDGVATGYYAFEIVATSNNCTIGVTPAPGGAWDVTGSTVDVTGSTVTFTNTYIGIMLWNGSTWQSALCNPSTGDMYVTNTPTDIANSTGGVISCTAATSTISSRTARRTLILQNSDLSPHPFWCRRDSDGVTDYGTKILPGQTLFLHNKSQAYYLECLTGQTAEVRWEEDW